MVASLIEIGKDDDGISISRWFKRHRPDVPHGLLQKLLRKGAVKLDGKKAKPDQKIITGQTIRIPELEDRLEERNKSKPKTTIATKEDAERLLLNNILYKDEDIIAINKPPGLPVQGGTNVKLSVDDMLEFLKFDYNQKPKIVHRIDKDTSGVMILARATSVARSLGELFKSKVVKKTYWAIVVGVPEKSSGKITLPLLTKTGTIEKTLVDEEQGKSAITKYKVIDTAGNKLAWVELQPITGRTHQLRAHMAAIGHPILGDGKYGAKEAFIDGLLSKKMHLHARNIRFNSNNITAPLPRHIEETFKLFGFEY